jgi:hypothetical protein
MSALIMHRKHNTIFTYGSCAWIEWDSGFQKIINDPNGAYAYNDPVVVEMFETICIIGAAYYLITGESDARW